MMGYFDELERNVVSAAERSVRRRHARTKFLQRVAFAAVIAIVAVAGLLVVRSEPARASSITVIPAGDALVVRVVLPDASPVTVVEDLRAEELSARQQPVPTGPSFVGEVLGLQGTGTGVVAEGDLAIRVPRDWEGSLLVLAGVAADPGEPYVVPTNAFAPGEPLHPAVAAGASVREVARAARTRGVGVRWLDADTGEPISSPDRCGRVPVALATSSSTVVAQVEVVGTKERGCA